MVFDPTAALRGYVYGRDWLPHDGIDTIIHGKLAGDRSRSIEGIMRAAGRNVRIIPKMLVTEGINAARTIFPQCRFDAEKCYEGLRALRMYQWGNPSASGVEKQTCCTTQIVARRRRRSCGVAIAVREETIASPRKIFGERRVMRRRNIARLDEPLASETVSCRLSAWPK